MTVSIEVDEWLYVSGCKDAARVRQFFGLPSTALVERLSGNLRWRVSTDRHQPPKRRHLVLVTD